MAIQTSLGATWEISAAAPATEDATGYAALSYTQVKEVQNLGAIGPTFEDVTFVPLEDGVTQHRKGAVDYGQLQVTMAVDTDDPGQALVASGVDGAEKSTVFSHKITLGDGAVRYFRGQIYSNPETVGDASTMILSEVMVMVSSTPVKVAAP
jgi:hypothetical protein